MAPQRIGGESVGPLRIWGRTDDIPGLAMSRSIGDFNASTVGVISTPEVIQHTVTPQDKFLVVASDGIWDFMSNDEVVAFVENHRGDCLKCVEGFRGSSVSVTNTCIAHYLCEEARSRWLESIGEEGGLIDDISCIIVEFCF